MINLKTIIVVNILLSFGLCVIYLHLYSQYREKYMGIWGIGWLFFSIRIGLDLLRFLGNDALMLLLLNQLISILSVVFLLWGIYSFSAQKMPGGWLYAAVLVTFATDIGMILGLPLILSVAPTALYFGIANMWTGIMFLYFCGLKGLGKRITGYTLILIGILNLSYPSASTGAGLVPVTVFFAVASVLWLIILMGILLVYFEKVRNDLNAGETRFRLLVENARDIIYRFYLSPERQFDYISPSVFQITGYTPEEIYQTPQVILNLLNEDHELSGEEVCKKFLLPGRASTFLIHCKNEKKVWVEQHCVPIYDDGGSLIGIEGIVRDISERKKVEIEMARLEQLRLIGQTAAGIAHEIRNPMTTVKGFLQMLMGKSDLVHYSEFLELMIAELNRANTIITDFLSLSKEKKSLLKAQSLNNIILNLKPIIETSALLSSKSMRFNLAETPDIQLDETEIRQVLLNLIQNGLEAMDSGGTLEINTSAQNGEVILAVKDQGKGFEPVVLEKLGEPFITTKEKGTGLGLAITYSIAHRHNAKIDIESGPDGTTILIKFKIESDQPAFL